MTLFSCSMQSSFSFLFFENDYSLEEIFYWLSVILWYIDNIPKPILCILCQHEINLHPISNPNYNFPKRKAHFANPPNNPATAPRSCVKL